MYANRTPVIVGRQVRFLTEGLSATNLSRAGVEREIARLEATLPKIVSERAKADAVAALAALRKGLELARANGL